MSSRPLTTLELRCASLLPRSTSIFSTWLSRWWRYGGRRIEAVVHLVILPCVTLIAAAMLVWRMDMAPARVLPDAFAWLMPVSALGAGLLTGTHAMQRCVRSLPSHWTGWAMDATQRARESFTELTWRAVTALTVASVAAFCISIRWELRPTHLAAGALAFLLAHFGAGTLQPNSAFAGRKPAKSARVRWRLPITLQLQARRPRILAFVAALCFGIVVSLSSIALITRSEGPLFVGCACALMGFLACLTLARPGASDLYAMSQWTGASAARMLGPLLWPATLLSLALALPLGAAALVLQHGLRVAVGVAPLCAAYVTLIWVIADLSGHSGRRGDAFFLLHVFVFALALLAGPAAFVLVPAHATWILRRGMQLWDRHR